MAKTNNDDMQVIRRFCQTADEFLEVAQTAISFESDYAKTAISAKRLQRKLRSLQVREDLLPKEGFHQHIPLINAGISRMESLTGLLNAIDLIGEDKSKRFDDRAFSEELRGKGLDHALRLLQILTADLTKLDTSELAIVLPHLGMELSGWKDLLRWLIKMLCLLILIVLWYFDLITLDEYIEYVLILGSLDVGADSQPPPPPPPPPQPGGVHVVSTPPVGTVVGPLVHCQERTVIIGRGEVIKLHHVGGTNPVAQLEVEVFDSDGRRIGRDDMRRDGDETSSYAGPATMKIHSFNPGEARGSAGYQVMAG